MMTTKHIALGLAGLGLLATAGCEDDTKYAYFTVNVTIGDAADQDFLARIATCGANVEGADADFSPLACSPGSVRNHQLGTFEWSTSETAGNVRFRVTLKDIAGMDLATGTSADVPIVSGQNTTTSVVAVPLPAALMPRTP